MLGGTSEDNRDWEQRTSAVGELKQDPCYLQVHIYLVLNKIFQLRSTRARFELRPFLIPNPMFSLKRQVTGIGIEAMGIMKTRGTVLEDLMV